MAGGMMAGDPLSAGSMMGGMTGMRGIAGRLGGRTATGVEAAPSLPACQNLPSYSVCQPLANLVACLPIGMEGIAGAIRPARRTPSAPTDSTTRRPLAATAAANIAPLGGRSAGSARGHALAHLPTAPRRFARSSHGSLHRRRSSSSNNSNSNSNSSSSSSSSSSSTGGKAASRLLGPACLEARNRRQGQAAGRRPPASRRRRSPSPPASITSERRCAAVWDLPARLPAAHLSVLGYNAAG